MDRHVSGGLTTVTNGFGVTGHSAHGFPENLMYRVETEHGAVGFQRPAGVPTGHASVATGNGRVTIWVWYV